jgi:hypothetical protein
MSKGGSTVIQEEAKIPEATPEERALQSRNLDYINYIMPSAFKLADIGMVGLNNQPLVDYKGLMTSGMGNINNIQNQFSQLQQGILPDAYRQNKEQVISEGVKNTLGQALNSLAGRGVINSSITSGVMNNLQKNVASQMAQGFNQDIATNSQLLEQAEGMAYSPLKYGSAVQNAAMEVPSKFFTMATGQYAPGNDAWKQMYGSRYSIATPASTMVQPDNSGGLLGGLMQGVGAYYGACFAAGTEIATPDGTVAIEDIEEGDEVFSLNDENELIKREVISVEAVKKDFKCIVTAGDNQVVTTQSQTFLTAEGGVMPTTSLQIGDKLLMLKGLTVTEATITRLEFTNEFISVYDFDVADTNVFFANGFAVEGWW